ncbi:hypothetical protein V1514DRAFT_340989 [Lipomyces japonicus]|uniref:uncharacterized protein n=1 Tax=Lipomyces japonicus TaxID=56871 RepID=UPI0034D00858
MSRPYINLDPVEIKIKKLLVQAAKSIDERDPERKSDLELRITGGWVRDKLLGRDSHDIDISINRLTGNKFANKLNGFLRSNRSWKLDPTPVFTVPSNPDKSKHLETTTIQLFDRDIDLVNLRSEEYTNESRIPSMDFGTAESDALRRDATINALFFNLQTGEIEDFTGHGLHDLRQGVIRTPLEPIKTFTDDPLRVLRLIRFSSNYNFKIEESTYQAMKLDVVKKALEEKVSKERVGIELRKTLCGPNALIGYKTLYTAGLFPILFKPVGLNVTDEQESAINDAVQHYINAFSYLQNLRPIPIVGAENENSEVYIRTNLEAIYLYTALNVWAINTDSTMRPSKAQKTIMTIIKDSLKLPGRVADNVVDLIDQVKVIIDIADKKSFSRLSVAYFIRALKGNYVYGIYSALVTKLAETSNLSLEEKQEVVKKFENLLSYIEEEKLTNVADQKPSVNGKEIMQLYGGLKNGPWMKEVVRQAFAYELEHPHAPREELEQYILSIKPEDL